MTKGSFLDSLSPRLTGEEPARLVPRESASVAVIFRDFKGEEVLLIKRAEREGDPWSGQIAFPGGMVSSGDGSFKDTAMRETSEEVGIDLSSDAAFLGYMRELKARMREVVVVPSVFKLTADSAAAPEQRGGLLRVGPAEEPGEEGGPFDVSTPEEGRGGRVPVARAWGPRHLGADREDPLGDDTKPDGGGR